MKSLNSNQNYAAILRFFGWPWVRKTIKQIAKLNVNNTRAEQEGDRQREGEREREVAETAVESEVVLEIQ